MSDYLTRVAGLRIPEDLEQITREFFAFAAERGEVFERITCAGPHGALQAQMERGVLERHGGDGVQDPERSLLMAFVTASTLAVYRQWVADGKRIPSDQAADLAAGLVCGGASAFRSSAGSGIPARRASQPVQLRYRSASPMNSANARAAGLAAFDK